MAESFAVRAHPLGTGAPVAVGLVGPATRLAFRGSPEAADLCARAFGCGLPWDACRAVESGDRAALRLGPDEWLLLAPEDAGAALFGAIETALGEIPHALVDISHRQVGFDIAGEAAATLLNTGCPLDLDLPVFPAGTCTRTILAKADVTLWRRASQRFRLEVNRSFARYLVDYLKMAERGL